MRFWAERNERWYIIWVAGNWAKITQRIPEITRRLNRVAPRRAHRRQAIRSEGKTTPMCEIYENRDRISKRNERAHPNIIPLFSQSASYRNSDGAMRRWFKSLYTYTICGIIDDVIAMLLNDSGGADLNKGYCDFLNRKLITQIKGNEEKLDEKEEFEPIGSKWAIETN